MRMLTAAQNDSDLAAAVGRFAQASTLLERAIAEAITRLLPITADMGLAILADNSMRANLDALDRLLALPETAISDDWKQKLIDRILRCAAALRIATGFCTIRSLSQKTDM